jgi:hypothetical protein
MHSVKSANVVCLDIGNAPFIDRPLGEMPVGLKLTEPRGGLAVEFVEVDFHAAFRRSCFRRSFSSADTISR